MHDHPYTNVVTHAQIHTHYTHICRGTYARWHSLKVSTVKQILSVFLCALFLTVLVFFTPPVAMCHHLPSQCWSQSYLQTVLREIHGQNFALGLLTMEQKYNGRTMFDIFIVCVLCSVVIHVEDNQTLQKLLFLFT